MEGYVLNPQYLNNQVIIKGSDEYLGTDLPTNQDLIDLGDLVTYNDLYITLKPSDIFDNKSEDNADNTKNNYGFFYGDYSLQTNGRTYVGGFTNSWKDSAGVDIEEVLNKNYLWIQEGASNVNNYVVEGQDVSLPTAQNLPVVLSSIAKIEEAGKYNINLILNTRNPL